MLKRTFIVLAGALAVALATPAFMAPEAGADTPKCKTKANKYGACTDKLRDKSLPRTPDVDGRDFLVWQKGYNRPNANKPKVGK